MESEAVVLRTARVALRVTDGQRRRCYEILRASGDVWAGLIEFNRVRFARGGKPVFGFTELCRELTGADLGPLARICAEDVAKRYSHACFETVARKKAGQRARYPRKKRALYPTRFRWGAFTLDGNRLRLAVAKGRPELWVRLSRAVPDPEQAVRSVTLVAEARRLFVDVTAAVRVEDHGLDPNRVAGVDLGIIHPYAVAGPDGLGLVVSGRALRAEERLHLEDTKRRAAKMGRRAPRRGQRGSKRWRKLRASQRAREARHVRKIRQAHHEAAKTVVTWAVEHRIGTLVVGDPKGITAQDSGRIQNRRVSTTWRRTHLSAALSNKCERAGIRVVLVDERGTSSTCPACRSRQRASGRTFSCSHCGLFAHRDLVGATNIAGKVSGGIVEVPTAASTTHRRAGTPPARRDRRRHLCDTRRAGHRSCPTPGRPTTVVGSRSERSRLVGASAPAGTDHAA